MGVYRRRDSPYWWLWLPGAPQGQHRVRTTIPVGVTPSERRASRADADACYHAQMVALARERYDLPGGRRILIATDRLSAFDIILTAIPLKGQVLTIALVVACGIAAFLSMLTAYDSLLVSRDTYYEQTAFAHVFATLKRAPKSLAAHLEGIPGVTAVDTRIVVDLTLDLPGVTDPITGRMISLPGGRPPTLDRLVLRTDRKSTRLNSSHRT